jgi:hypothetical protein
MSGPERHAILIVRVIVRPGGVAEECRTDVVVTSSADLRSRRLIRVRLHRLDDDRADLAGRVGRLVRIR